MTTAINFGALLLIGAAWFFAAIGVALFFAALFHGAKQPPSDVNWDADFTATVTDSPLEQTRRERIAAAERGHMHAARAKARRIG